MVFCIQCGELAVQKTAKPTKFCSKKCGSKYRYWQNPTYHNAVSKKFYYENREYNIKRSAEWIKRNPERARASNNKATRRYKDKVRYGNLRDSVYKKFDSKCNECGSTENLHIHHIDQKGWWDGGKPNNALDNLVLLCASHHQKLHWNTNRRMKRKSDTPSNRS